MNIQITSGIGHGPTELSAFDQALVKAGVHNFNLIYLSSVIPPESKIVEVENIENIDGKWGDRLYVVMAQQRTSQRDEEVWAGIGWVQDPTTNKGLLVEHEGHSEQQIRNDIKNSLQALIDNRPGSNFGEINMKVVGATCEDNPVCALVVAAFETAAWNN